MSVSVYGLIGRKLSHSFSSDFFNTMFQKEGINAQYKNFEIPEIESIYELLRNTPNIKGFNVTIPYKSSIIPFLDSIDAEAQKIRAVNTVRIFNLNNSLHLRGYNTDVIGFGKTLRPLLSKNMKKALILGSGGASKAVSEALKTLDIDFTIVSRNNVNCTSYDSLTIDKIKETLLIINTTPLGMFPDICSFPDIPYEGIGPEHLCYDLIYNPKETVFMNKCKSNGAHVCNGYDMLVAQAMAAWKIWNQR